MTIPEGFYEEDGKLHRQHDINGGPHDEPPAPGPYQALDAERRKAWRRAEDTDLTIEARKFWRGVAEGLGIALVALQGALAAPEREILWKRQVTPHVALGVDDSHSIVLIISGDGVHQTISNGDALTRAVDDCRAYVTFREAVAKDWPDDPERVTLTVENTFPRSD